MLVNRRQLLATSCLIGLTQFLPRLAGARVTSLQTKASVCSEQQNISSWDNDKHYNVRVDHIDRGDGKEWKSIRYMADIIDISSEYTPSIIRDADTCAENVSDLIIDARRANLIDSLSFVGVKLHIFSHELNVEGSAVITIVRSGDGQGEILVVAHSLRLPKDKFIKPFNIYADPNGKLPSIRFYSENVSVGDTRPNRRGSTGSNLELYWSLG